LMTCNLMLAAEDWMMFNLADSSNSKDYQFDLRPDGYPASLPPNIMAGTYLSRSMAEQYPAGTYLIRYKGDHIKGKLNVDHINVTKVSEKPGLIVIRKEVSDEEGIFIGIERTNQFDPIRDIDVRWAGYKGSGTWQPKFLAAMQYSCLRFMDCGKTNESHEPPITQFNQLPKGDERSWALGTGMPIAKMVELSNLQDSDLWYCIPHAMSNEGIKRIAQQIARGLEAGLRAYLELSNEWWNYSFPQNAHFLAQGKQRLTRLPEESRFDDLYYGRRAMQAMEVCRQVFEAANRADQFCPVLPVHTGAPGREDYFRQCLPKGKRMGDFYKAYAIAPYFGYSVFNGSETTWPIVQTWLDLPLAERLDRYFEYLINDQHLPPESSVSAIIGQITHHKQMAESWGLELVAYEWGPHGRAEGDLAHDPRIAELIKAAGTDPRMGTAMDLVLGHWHLIGGSTMCFFNGPVGEATVWGDWALRESYKSINGKYETLQRWSNKT
jgi:hypothetical protein